MSPYKICQVSTNINFNFNHKSWETGHKLEEKLVVKQNKFIFFINRDFLIFSMIFITWHSQSFYL
jgi:hypothetical protein